mgnify:CR=1 FL=1
MFSTEIATPGWHAELRAGDVVAFRFPLAERRKRVVPKTRPCLVLAVSDRDGVPHALVAYGTSADTSANRGQEVAVATPAGMAAAGLHKPTRFVGARRMLVPLTSPRFRLRPETGAPILGKLSSADRHALFDVARAILCEQTGGSRPQRPALPTASTTLTPHPKGPSR